MNKGIVVNFREATKSDIDFLSHILLSAATASGVSIEPADLPTHPDTYQYVEGFPKGADTGIVAETSNGALVGAAWVRLLPTDAHTINEPLPELTMGVMPEYRRMGIGKRLMEELYKAVQRNGIFKISLGVHKNNTPAVNLYKQQNWMDDGYYEEYRMMSKEIDDNREYSNNMKNFSELIKSRRSMRKFTDQELSQEQVVTLLKAALMAPTSKRSNGWQFIAVDDKAKLTELSHCKEQASSFIADAALAIVVTADPLASDVWIEDASIASILIQLQAEDLGLGSCWVQVRERFAASGMPSDEYVRGILDIPLQLQVLSVIAIGHKGMERKPFDEAHLQWEKIHINKFGGE